MNRQEFVARLEEALQGEVSPRVVHSNAQYYNDYILTEVSRGRDEQEVLAELGDPRLIARTIFDSQEAAAGNYGRERYTYEEPNSREAYRYDSRGGRSTVTNEDMPVSAGLSGLLGRLLPVLILVGIVVAVVSVLSLVFSAALVILSSPVFWGVLIVWAAWSLFRRR